MTTILRNVSKISWKKEIQVEESDKKFVYKDKEIDWIDYSETTSMSYFCGIRFKGEKDIWWVKSHGIEELKN